MKLSLAKIKTHLYENRKVYIVGTICFVAGAVCVLIFKKGDVITQTVSGSDNTVIGKAENVTIVSNYLNGRGYVAKAVKCLETGDEFSSQIEAAIAYNVSPANFSKHMNGKLPDIHGLHFEYA